MRLKPRYDTPGFLRFEGPLDDPSVPLLRQRRRLASIVAELDDAQWATPSRCEGWSVQDVIAHLVDTDRFWAISIAAGRRIQQLQGVRENFVCVSECPCGAIDRVAEDV